MKNHIKGIVIIFLSFLTTICFSQEDENNQPLHLKVKRLNDSYIDVYYNKPISDKMPIMIFCQGSGYDSNTEGFLGVIGQFESQIVGMAIEKQGVKFGDSGDNLTEEYIENTQSKTDFMTIYVYYNIYEQMLIGGMEKFM